jgi:hypothetical protein
MVMTEDDPRSAAWQRNLIERIDRILAENLIERIDRILAELAALRAAIEVPLEERRER